MNAMGEEFASKVTTIIQKLDAAFPLSQNHTSETARSIYALCGIASVIIGSKLVENNVQFAKKVIL